MNTFAFSAVIYMYVVWTSIVFVVVKIYSYSVVKGVHVQVRLTNGNKSTLLFTISCSITSCLKDS